MGKLRKIMEKLIDDTPLNAVHRDHQLQGEMKQYRDCHIEGDWILLYEFCKL